MNKQLWSDFPQVFMRVTCFLILLITFFGQGQEFTVTYLWRLLGSILLLSLTFGVVYSYLWDHSTFKAATNIILSSFANMTAALGSLWLCAPTAFNYFQAYLIYYFLLTLAGHTLGFYFYSRYQNRKLAHQLNDKLQ